MEIQRQPYLVTHALTIGYPVSRRERRVVASALSVSLFSGELTCLIGPNGAGKSTLLRTLAGMQPPLSGTIHLMGEAVHTLTPHRLARRLSVVLTDRVEVGNLSACGLVALGRHPYTDWLGRLSAHDEEIIRQSLEAVDAMPLAARNLSELSDGERQKVMIARALAQEPAIIILDEPTAFLDLPHRVEIMHTLRNLARRTGKAVLLSTHDLDLALRSADSLWLMPAGGNLQVGAPEDLVLAGAFKAAFETSAAVFDVQSGSFRFHNEAPGEIALQAEGIPAIWTARALERAGFAIHSEAARQLIVHQIDGALSWELREEGQSQIFHSVYDLLASLRI